MWNTIVLWGRDLLGFIESSPGAAGLVGAIMGALLGALVCVCFSLRIAKNSMSLEAMKVFNDNIDRLRMLVEFDDRRVVYSDLHDDEKAQICTLRYWFSGLAYLYVKRKVIRKIFDNSGITDELIQVNNILVEKVNEAGENKQWKYLSMVERKKLGMWKYYSRRKNIKEE